MLRIHIAVKDLKSLFSLVVYIGSFVIPLLVLVAHDAAAQLLRHKKLGREKKGKKGNFKELLWWCCWSI